MVIKLKSKQFTFWKKGHFEVFDLKIFTRLNLCESSLGGDADDETLNWLEMDGGLQSLASTGLACYLPPSRSGFYAPQSCLLQTHFKEGLPIHCAYMVSQT